MNELAPADRMLVGFLLNSTPRAGSHENYAITVKRRENVILEFMFRSN